MAYDGAAARQYVQHLIGDYPISSIFTTAEYDNYVNMALAEWVHRFERRTGKSFFATVTAGTGVYEEIQVTNSGSPIEHVSINDGTIEYTIKREEYNRIRYLQTGEGAVGTPDIWAEFKAADGYTYITYYPFDDNNYNLTVWGIGFVSPGDTTFVDPISFHMMARLAAYRAGCDADLPARRLRAIIRPVAGWIRSHGNMQWLFEDKNRAAMDSFLYPKERINA